MKRNFYHKSERPPLSFCHCSGKSKICYKTREAALSARNKTATRALELRAYKCPLLPSRGWHLTHRVQY